LDLSREFVHERVLDAVVRAARTVGIDLDLRALAPTRRMWGLDALVPANEHVAVMRTIFSDRRETLGIELARHLPLEGIGLWGFLLRSSETFGDMLRRAERYMRVANRYREFSLETRDGCIAMVCPHPDPSPYGPREQVVAAHLGHWVTWGRQLTRADIGVKEARFRWSGPQDEVPFEHFFGGRTRFGADEDALLFEPRVLDLPLPECAPEMAERFEAYASVLIREMQPDASFADRVRDVLGKAILTDSANESDIARHFTMTIRTLHRRLEESGTSFRKIRSELLRQRAEQLLRQRRIPIAEVSYLLGYAEPSNFHRAFRRWTGLTPTEWRAGGRK
jgi:AraC-like DNA-binding protein